MTQRFAPCISELGAKLGISTAAQLQKPESLPVTNVLAGLFPDGIPRGCTINVDSTTIMLSLLAGPTQNGAWAAVAGFPDVGIVAAQELGVDLPRCAFIPYFTTNSAAKVFAALIDSVDMVVVHKAQEVLTSDVRRLLARVRERKCVLILSNTTWPDAASSTIRVKAASWQQSASGFGRLKGRQMEVSIAGRGSMNRPRISSMFIGDPSCSKNPYIYTDSYKESLQKTAV